MEAADAGSASTGSVDLGTGSTAGRMHGVPAAVTASAHPNIALVKYWGKSDDRLILPAAGSLSLTLDVFPTVTSVALDAALNHDSVELDGRPASPAAAARVRAFLDLVRGRVPGAADPAAHLPRARVVTRNTVPTGAGLASSAAGFAALATAAAAAYGLPAGRRELSRLARRGSGSACRSVIPGLAVWHAGDDASSFAEPVDGPALGMVIAVVDAGGKKIPSREAMTRTRQTSPYYAAWVRESAADLREACAALERDDITALGAIVESNALRMHAAIAACRPPIRYLAPASLAVFDAAQALRDAGLEAYATADAGPNVALVCRAADVAAVRDGLARRLREQGLQERSMPGSGLPQPGMPVWAEHGVRLVAAQAGPGARLTGPADADAARRASA